MDVEQSEEEAEIEEQRDEGESRGLLDQQNEYNLGRDQDGTRQVREGEESEES